MRVLIDVPRDEIEEAEAMDIIASTPDPDWDELARLFGTDDEEVKDNGVRNHPYVARPSDGRDEA